MTTALIDLKLFKIGIYGSYEDHFWFEDNLIDMCPVVVDYIIENILIESKNSSIITV